MLLRPVVRNGRPGLIGTMAGTTVVVGLSQRKEKGAPPSTAGPPATAGPPPAAPADPIAQLKELADLRDRGALTEEEFTAQKARILGG